MEELGLRLSAILLVSLRVGPTLAFAPPFTLLRVPVPVRVLLALALAATLAEAHPEASLAALREGRPLLSLALGELLVGGAVALALQLMRLSLTAGIDRTDRPAAVLATLRAVYWPAFEPLLTLGLALMALLVLLELLQLRGFLFTTDPLKPDFSRLNPAKGLKRLFSMRMVKETAKNIVKLVVYAGLAWLVISGVIATFGDTLGDAASLARAMAGGMRRLLLAFLCAALVFMALDQLIARGEFRKQMRMSRREITREAREREGEPRLKQKRRQLHQEIRKQAEGLGRLEGSDFLVTNPEHFAVALAYDPEAMEAPVVRARGRNHFAQLMKRKARLLGLPIIADPALARALYRDCRADRPIGPQHFHAVARHYAATRRRAAEGGGKGAADG